MSALPSVGPYTLWRTTQTALTGEQHELTVEDHRRGIDHLVEAKTTENSLSSQEAEEYRQRLMDALPTLVNDNPQLRILFGTSSNTRISVTLKETTRDIIQLTNGHTGIRSNHYHIFEKNDKTYANQAEKDSWYPRIRMIEMALGTSQIFSISIIPTNPNTEQSWYQKNRGSYRMPEDWMVEVVESIIHPKLWVPPSREATPASAPAPAQETTQNLFEIQPPAPEPVTASLSYGLDDLPAEARELISAPQEPIHNISPEYQVGSTGTEKYNVGEESLDSTPSKLLGFFAPFSDFSSSAARAHHDPDHLPPSVIRVNVFATNEMENVMRNLKNDTIRTSMERIVDAFVEDEHSRAIGLIVLEQPIKTLFFEKVY